MGCGNTISLLINIIFFRPISWRDDTKILGGDKHIKVSIPHEDVISYDNPTEHEIEKESQSQLRKQGSTIGNTRTTPELKTQKSKLSKQGSTISEKPKMTMRRANSSVTEDPPKLTTQSSTIKDNNNPKLVKQGSTVADKSKVTVRRASSSVNEDQPKLTTQTSKVLPPKTPLKTKTVVDGILPSTPQMNNLFSSPNSNTKTSTTTNNEFSLGDAAEDTPDGFSKGSISKTEDVEHFTDK